MSSGSKQRPTSQLNLLLRIAAGAYLVYLTFDMRQNFTQSPTFIAAAVVFALSGAALLLSSVRRMKKGELDYLDSHGNVIVPDDLPEENENSPEEDTIHE